MATEEQTQLAIKMGEGQGTGSNYLNRRRVKDGLMGISAF